MKKTILCTAILSLLTAVARAQNENVTWQMPVAISGAADVSTLGTYVGSWAPSDGNANTLPVNGVAFQGYTDLSGFGSAGFGSGYNAFPNPNTSNNNYNSLLQYASYDGSGNGSGDTVTWSDIPGHTYLIQIWVNGNAAGRSETVTGGANTSGTINYGSSAQYIIGTYVADGSRSETITFSGSASTNGNYPQINLLLIRDITIPPASITWQTPATISGATDVSTQGTYFGSWAPYASSSLAVNGVTFQNSSDLPHFSNTGFNAGYGGFPNPGTPDNNYNTLLQSAAYEYPGPACTFSWGGMTPGHAYLLQFWVNGNDTSRTETLTGGTNTSAAINYDPGHYINGTFVADYTGSMTVTLNGATGDNYPQVNLVQVRDITAPSPTNYQGAVLADHPLGYWPLDLTVDTAGIATDLSGNNNDGTYYNISSGNLVAGPTAYLTNAVSFSGAEVYFTSATNTAVLDFSGPTTLEAWAQPSDMTTFGDIIAKGYDMNNYQEIALRENGVYGTNYYGYFGTGGITAGQQNTNWVYLVLSNDGVYDYLYINGYLVQKVPDERGSIVFANFIDWAIGNGTSGGNGRTFAGNLCQVAIYNYGLTAAQVVNHYDAAEFNAAPAASVPTIAIQPQSQQSYVGGSVTFSVGVVSGLATTNQWYEGSTPLTGQTGSTLTLTDLTLSSAGNYHVVVGNANGNTNSAVATLTVTTPSNLEWNSTSSSTWDTDNSANWLNLSTSQTTVFNSGDLVLFNDTPGVMTSVSVSGTVIPSQITINSTNNNFAISGGNFSGPGNFLKEGPSSASITTGSGLSGTATIAGGSVYAGNNCFSSVSAVYITNNATMDMGGGTFNNNKPFYVSGTGVNGQGALINSYNDGPVQSMNITLTGDTLFGASDRWDLNTGSEISGPHNLTMNWSAGAGYSQWNSIILGANLASISLNSTGTNPASSLGMNGMDTACQNPGLVLNVNSNSTVAFYSGGYNGSLHIAQGGLVYIYGTPPLQFSGSTLTLDTGSSLQCYYNATNVPITIGGTVTLNGIAHLVLGDHPMAYPNVISGPGGFVFDYYNNAMVLSAANTYTGPTVIGSGPEVALTNNGSISASSLIFFGGSNPTVTHMDVSGRTDQTLTLASGQTLAGIGSVSGNLVVSSGATISPAGTNTTIGITTGSNATGMLAATNNITLNGTTIIKLNGSGTNDEIQAGGTVTFGGALNLDNISGASLAAGNSFQVFNAAGYAGSFASITPATPGAGLAWNTTQLNSNGSISVVTTGGGLTISSTVVSGSNLIFSGTGGTSGDTYYVLGTTNLLTPLANWTVVSTNVFDSSGNFSVTNAISQGVPQRFYSITLPAQE